MHPERFYKLIGLVVFCFATFSLQAKGEDALWKRANNFYQQKQYDSALSCYHLIEKRGFQNAALFFNMGNAYYRLGSTAPAVLYFEKALFKDPLNSKIKDNLTLAQSRVGLPVSPSAPVFFIAWWNNFKVFFAPQIWAWLMFLSFLFLLGLLYKKFKSKNAVNYMGRWVTFAVCGIIICGICFYASYQARTETNKAVIMVDNTSFFAKPGGDTPSGQLPDGAVVEIQSRNNDWYFVTLPNGNAAWVAAGNLSKVQS